VTWDLLLEWMTHLGSGRWGAFRDAAAELSGAEDTDLRDMCRALRVALSDLGHVDFFVDGTRRWRVRRPALLGLLSNGGEALLAGGRTRRLMDALNTAAGEAGADVRVDEVGPGLSQVRVVGTAEQVSAVADTVDIEYIPAAASMIASQLTPMRRVLDRAPVQQEPFSWAVRSWSFEEMTWVDSRLRKTAREYFSKHGTRRCMVEVGRGRLREIERRHAVYAAALLRRRRIATYRVDEHLLQVPLTAPLPDLFARAACLASGQLPRLADGRLEFRDVPPDAASVLLVSLGQGHPLEGAKP